MDANDQSSDWEDTDIYCQFTGNSLQINKKISQLRHIFHSDEIQIQIGFQSYHILDKFQRKLEQQSQNLQIQRYKRDKNQFKDLLFQFYKKTLPTKRSQLQGLKMFEIVFRNRLWLSIFCSQYSNRIFLMESQYNYHILPLERKLTIYLKDTNQKKLSTFFIAQIIELKNKLIIYIQNDQQIYQKMLYSKIAEQRLLKESIRFAIISKFRIVAFYSQVHSSVFSISKQIRKILAYHVSIIKLPQGSIDSYMLQQMMKLIVLQIRPILSQVQLNYDMPVQINIEKSAILINDFHEVFNDGVQLIKQGMGRLKLIEIQCGDLLQLRKLLSNTRFSRIIKSQICYRKCFILFPDKTAAWSVIDLETICTQLSSFFGSEYTLIIHLVHLLQDKQKVTLQIQRVKKLASVYHLDLPSFHRILDNKQCHKIVVKPKQLGTYAQKIRQQQIKLFLYDFLSNKNVSDEILPPPMIQENVNINFTTICQNNRTCLSYQKSLNSPINDIQRSNSQAQGLQGQSFTKNQPILTIPIQYPQKIQLDGKAYKKLRRDRQIEKILQNKLNRKLRVSLIGINSTIMLPQVYTNYTIDIFQDVFKQLHQNQHQFKQYSQIQQKEVSQYKQKQKAFLCFMNKRDQTIVPLYQIQFVN